MTLPNLPAQGSTAWYSWAQGIHTVAATHPYVNVKEFGAKGDGVTDDTVAIQAAIDYADDQGLQIRAGDDWVAHDHRGVPVHFPVGTYVVTAPLIMPRSGFYRAKTVGLVGQSMGACRIVAGASFPSNRALIEWSPDAGVAAAHYRVRDQVFMNLTLVPKLEVGSMAIWNKLQSDPATYTLANINNVDQTYNLRFENLIIMGDNSYHQTLIRLEGRNDYVYANNICADTNLGTGAFNTRLFQFDDFSTTWTQFSATNWALYDWPGSNYSKFTNFFQGFRGGGCCFIWGRVSMSEIGGMQCGIGNVANTEPDMYIRDGGLLNCHDWVSEGQKEQGIFKFENCWNVRLSDFCLGVTDGGTAQSPGYGLYLVNVHDSQIQNRPGPRGAQAFSGANSYLINVDAACSDIKFTNITGNADFELECLIDPAADNIEIDYRNVLSGKRWNISNRGVSATVKVAGVNLLLSAHPMGRGITTSAIAKDTWHFVPVKLNRATAVSALKINVTAAATGGTAAGQFALYTTTAEWNRPGLLKTDYASYGTVDLATVGTKTLTTAGLVLPAGDWWLGWAWTGTATTSPSLTCVTGVHPLVAGTSIGADATGYKVARAGNAPGASAGVDGSTIAGVAIYGTLA